MSDFQGDKYKFSTEVPVTVVLEKVIEKRKEEITRLEEELLAYKILIKDLSLEDASYSIRNKILNISYFMIGDPELFEYLTTTKRFPINMLINRTPIDKEFFQEWKEYIIAYVVMLSNPNYKYLQEYMQMVDSINILGKDELFEGIKKSEHKGVIIKKGIRNAIILTSDGAFIKVKAKKHNNIGEDLISTEAKTLRKYKLQISILLSFIMITFIMGTFQYKSIDKTIVVETTSAITLEVNKFGKIIDSYSKTEKGNEMLSQLSINDLTVDSSIMDILSYSMDNEMIPETGILITVTGNPLEYGTLKNTEEFIKETGIEVKFNNSGNENKVSP